MEDRPSGYGHILHACFSILSAWMEQEKKNLLKLLYIGCRRRLPAACRDRNEKDDSGLGVVYYPMHKA